MSDDPGHTRILLSDRQERPVDLEALRALAERCLAGEGVTDAELSVAFVTEGEMADLHERFMGEPGPTDVLSFRMDESEEGVRILGDVVIAPAVAATNNQDVDEELRLLLVHGILHLLGHDHEDEGEKARMWERQARYVETVPG